MTKEQTALRTLYFRSVEAFLDAELQFRLYATRDGDVDFSELKLLRAKYDRAFAERNKTLFRYISSFGDKQMSLFVDLLF